MGNITILGGRLRYTQHLAYIRADSAYPTQDLVVLKGFGVCQIFWKKWPFFQRIIKPFPEYAVYNAGVISVDDPIT